jgi:hypothetical protein
MSADMFMEEAFNWIHGLGQLDLLTLRALAPRGVFTTRARGIYESQVGNIRELDDIAPVIFADDFLFVNQLPEDWREQLIALVKLAYQKGIRTPDLRVKDL